MARASTPSSPPLAASTSLGGAYEVLGLLGEGGAGFVYDAIRTLTRERVALKVLHGHLVGDRQIRGRFEREAKILRRLSGPHVCPVLDSGEIADPRDESRTLLFMALPKVDGPTLESVIAKGLLPMARVLDVMSQICDALRAAHAQGIVHRDLKPANVLLRGGTHVVVVDFGLAKILAGDVAATVLTAHNMVCGTPEYMAPEQARGDEIDARCDLYAAGVILYELLAGERPFTGPTPLAVLTAHLTSEATRPRERAPEREISPALDAVTMHAMAKEPRARYASAQALSAALLRARSEPGDIDAVRPEAPHAATVPSFPSSPTPQRSQAPSSRSVPPRASVEPPAAPAPPWRWIWVAVILISASLGVWLAARSP
jgi:serine/threonine-protein kinase